MLNMLPSLWTGALWVSYVLYVLCFIPQVFTNYRLKSVSGVSSATVLLYYGGYFLEVLFAYFLDLPLACRVILPIGFLVSLVLVGQSLYYAESKEIFYRTLRLYAGVNTLFIALAILGVWYPYYVGHFCGWVATTAFAFYQVPQIIKHFVSRSVDGFNPALIALEASAAFLEVAAAFAIPLPQQVIYNGVRAFLCAAVLLVQFVLYRDALYQCAAE